MSQRGANQPSAGQDCLHMPFFSQNSPKTRAQPLQTQEASGRLASNSLARATHTRRRMMFKFKLCSLGREKQPARSELANICGRLGAPWGHKRRNVSSRQPVASGRRSSRQPAVCHPHQLRLICHRVLLPAGLLSSRAIIFLSAFLLPPFSVSVSVFGKLWASLRAFCKISSSNLEAPWTPVREAANCTRALFVCLCLWAPPNRVTRLPSEHTSPNQAQLRAAKRGPQFGGAKTGAFDWGPNGDKGESTEHSWCKTRNTSGPQVSPFQRGSGPPFGTHSGPPLRAPKGF